MAGVTEALGEGGLEAAAIVGAGGAERVGARGAARTGAARTGVAGAAAGGFTGAGASATLEATGNISFLAVSLAVGMDGAGTWFLFSIILSLDFTGAFSKSSLFT
jgi:hypothetical protein